jgi:RNA polymerase sigma factor (sigma-70 family)
MTDEQAMTALTKGELEKAAILYERYKKPLINFFLYHNAQRDDARDLVQQVFLRLLRYKHSYREGASFRTWIYEIARNILYDFYKKKPNLTDLSQLPDQADEEYNDLPYENVHLALIQLPDHYREVLILSRFQNMTYDEIGQLLGLSVPNVKVRIFRAIQKLRVLYFQLDNP